MYYVDYHLHPYSHGEKAVRPIHNLERLRQFVEYAKKINIKEIGFSDHEKYLDSYKWENLFKIKEETDILIKIGVEIDYKSGREEEIYNLLNKYPLDFAIGSVHHIGDWNFDHPDYRDRFDEWNINELYKKYFTEIKNAVISGLFNIIGHLDLIKIYGHRISPHKITRLVEPIMQEIKTNEQALEININGLNKPVQEIYPSKHILKIAAQNNVPLTFASDAHQPERIGENIDYIYNMINLLGYKKIAIFEDRKMKLHNIKIEKE
ncbi:MAG: histidinol-phosphatase HisJ family protein [Bacillota bacterium]